MPNYAQMNPGLHHVGYRFPNTSFSDEMIEEVKQMVSLRFKSAVVVNRVVYVGNVKKTDLKGQVTVEGDSMYKSAVGKFDQFSNFRRIEVTVRDGDEIVKLEEYADRILQFKKDKMHLVNISQDIEFLEDTFMHKGTRHPASVCKTDYGVAWANRYGVYLYDGQKVINLFEKGGKQIIKESDWKDFLAADKSYSASDTELTPMVGYIPHKRQIVIFDDITNNSTAEPRMYLYDMVTQSWAQGSDDGTNRQIDAIKTNFAHDKFGNLIYVHTTQTVAKWNDKQSAGQEFEVITKDIDFGEPGRRKKVYKVLVTYDSGNATSNVQVDYDVNGGTTFPYDFADGTNFASTELATANGWQVAELKPDVSSEANNIKSFRLRFATDGTVPSGFKINDISIIYRMKPAK
jgi:hypothetical protein